VLADVIMSGVRVRPGPLVKVNARPIPETLLESELFGHEKGSFTGAHVQRIGRFRGANDGTFFWMNCRDSPQLQAKLLRVTQMERFSASARIARYGPNARILAASTSNLEARLKTHVSARICFTA